MCGSCKVVFTFENNEKQKLGVKGKSSGLQVKKESLFFIKKKMAAFLSKIKPVNERIVPLKLPS